MCRRNAIFHSFVIAMRARALTIARLPFSLSFTRSSSLFILCVLCAIVNVATSVLNVRCVKWIYELLNYLLVEPGTDVAEHKNIIAKIHRTDEHFGVLLAAFFALAAEMNYYY